MDGVFMGKFMKGCLCLILAAAFIQVTAAVKDKQYLGDNLIRLHIVADSDSIEDQSVKLKVRDAVVSYLEPTVKKMSSKNEAMRYLQNHTAEIESVANKVLQAENSVHSAVVTLTRESFTTRDYDTFSLPAGMYDSLRIRIGSGNGRNWWCVVFPSLCQPATSDAFYSEAVSSGFDRDLTETLMTDDGYSIRFYILDCLGKAENFLNKE